MALPVLILLQLLWLAPPSSSKSLDPSVLEADGVGCDRIPYPFGVSGSSLGRAFELDCDPGENGSISLPLGSTTLQVLNFSLAGGYLRALLQGFSSGCGRSSTANGTMELDLEGTPFTFSNTMNKFTVIGCDAMAVINFPPNHRTGCVSFCPTLESVMDDGSCSGVGCCQVSIPEGLKRLQPQFSSIRNLVAGSSSPMARRSFPRNSSGREVPYNLPPANDTDLCTKAFVLEQGRLNFSKGEIRRDLDRARLDTAMPVVLDWAIGNETCQQVHRRNATDCACMKNSECYNVQNGAGGYRCKCKDGYIGNPYIPDGCKGKSSNALHALSCPELYYRAHQMGFSFFFFFYFLFQ